MPTRVVAAIIQRDEAILLARRDSGSLKDKWEFPGGKVEEGESPESALEREILEEFGTTVSVGPFFTEVPFEIHGKPYVLMAFRATHVSGRYAPNSHTEVCWVKPGDLLNFDLAPADIPIAAAVKELLA